jgi:4-hydroxy-3-polyprenylbenzoate decarboxylase
MSPDRVVVGMSGREGIAYGARLLEVLGERSFERHLVASSRARDALGAHVGFGPGALRLLADRIYGDDNQAARISSGSFLTRGMVVAPCSLGSLAAIANGLATNLVHRAADVTVKEGRPLVLGLVEEPSELDCENLERLQAVPGVFVDSLPRLGEAGERADAALERGVDRLLARLGIAPASPDEISAARTRRLGVTGTG